MKGICNRNYLLPGRRKGEMVAAHSLLTEDWFGGGQQITEQEYCCSLADRVATGDDKGKCLQKQLCSERAKRFFHFSHFSLKSREGICDVTFHPFAIIVLWRENCLRTNLIYTSFHTEAVTWLCVHSACLSTWVSGCKHRCPKLCSLLVDLRSIASALSSGHLHENTGGCLFSYSLLPLLLKKY